MHCEALAAAAELQDAMPRPAVMSPWWHMTNSPCRIRQLRSWWWHIEVATDYHRWANVIGVEGVDKTESSNEQDQDEG